MKKNMVLFLILLVALAGCATHGTQELREKSILINPGMPKAGVADILGAPGNRQFDGKNEAWQYKGYGMMEDDLHVVWFYDGVVVGYTAESSKDLPFGYDYKRINWEDAPDFTLEKRTR